MSAPAICYCFSDGNSVDATGRHIEADFAYLDERTVASYSLPDRFARIYCRECVLEDLAGMAM